ncbi:hypothetical protein [Streptomyces cavourensis]|uniref:SUKH-3 immunity protein of toxin-antitoxin system n=1 Tax=Streptomyces cavourensis TaxID=67258 RepID=A0ABY5FB69_9ACTN|nr:hypothetical protein [Streptomyces cavourensis]UTR80982.1 hypothetical protein NLU04_22155 [Streptomyces cavourensis]
MTATAPVSPVPVAPAGLSERARRYVEVAGVRVDRQNLGQRREAWIGLGVPAREIDRATAFQDRWGGLALPPAPFYEGGPRILGADRPEGSATEGWWHPAGNSRVSTAYGFMIGPDGAFGIHAHRWTPLHASTHGWVESLALADHARRWARSVTRVTRGAVEALDLGGFEPVPEVRGVTDTWWRGRDSLIAVYRGEAVGMDAPQCLEAHVYEGLDEWGLHGG